MVLITLRLKLEKDTLKKGVLYFLKKPLDARYTALYVIYN